MTTNVLITVSKRGRPFRDADLRKIVSDALDEEAEYDKRQFGDTVATWSNKPLFTITRKTSEPQTRIIKTDKRRRAGKIFGHVDKGTRAHIIKPKRARVLTFKIGGAAKTTPSSLKSRSGKKGTTQVFTQMVHHPGVKARNFSKKIQEKSRGRLKKNIDKRIAKAIRKTR